MKDNRSDMKFSLRAARCHDHRGEHGPAVANYLGILKLIPANRNALESEFLVCFEKFVRRLETAKNFEEANDYFSMVSDLYPRSPRFLTMWGEFLSRRQLHEEAALCFMKSLDLQPDYGEAKRSLRNLRYGLIDQWHFRMLNDRQRNAAYEQALSVCLARSRLPTPVHVLDIGAGTGILSMLALEVGAQKVYACESSTVMCQMAKKIFAENGFGRNGEAVLVEKHSKDVELDDLNGDRVHLVVTELMDAGFFGEGIIGTLLDAKRRLLIPTGGLIIPSTAKIWACLIECEAIRRSNSAIIGDRANRIVSSVCTGVPSTSAAASETSSAANRQEPYTSTMLSKVNGGFRYLSRPFLIDEIDLNDDADLIRHHSGFSESITATVIDSGFLDAIACWFEVDLLPATIYKTRISICTKPEALNSAWEQAVFPVPFLNSRRLVGDSVKIEMTIEDDWLQLSIGSDIDSDHPDSGIIITDATVDHPDLPAVITDTSIIEAINDDQLISYYDRQLCDDQARPLTILDLTGNPRLTCMVSSNRRRVFAVCQNSEAELITRLLTSMKSVTVTSSIDDLEQQLTDDQPIIDALIFCPVESCGLFKPNALEDLAFCRLRFNVSIVVPRSIDIVALLIESEELQRYARVISDQNTLGLKIKNVINVFETDIQRDLEISTLSHKRLCRPTKLMTLDFTEPLADGDSLPEFLSQTTSSSLETTAAGIVHGLLFWYEFSAAESGLSTADTKTHFRVAAALTNPFEVDSGDLVTVRTMLERSELYFTTTLFSLADL